MNMMEVALLITPAAALLIAGVLYYVVKHAD